MVLPVQLERPIFSGNLSFQLLILLFQFSNFIINVLVKVASGGTLLQVESEPSLPFIYRLLLSESSVMFVLLEQFERFRLQSLFEQDSLLKVLSRFLAFLKEQFAGGKLTTLLRVGVIRAAFGFVLYGANKGDSSSLARFSFR